MGYGIFVSPAEGAAGGEKYAIRLHFTQEKRKTKLPLEIHISFKRKKNKKASVNTSNAQKTRSATHVPGKPTPD